MLLRPLIKMLIFKEMVDNMKELAVLFKGVVTGADKIPVNHHF
jgi:hypothetical protein